jgi:hypothetical protein
MQIRSFRGSAARLGSSHSKVRARLGPDPRRALGLAEPPVPHQQAGHVTAPDQLLNVRKSLPGGRPHVTPKGHFKRIAIPRAGYWPLVGQVWQNLP